MDDTSPTTGTTPNQANRVSPLAAGDLQRLRPLRYEKRVARNRFILLVVLLFVFLLGWFMVFVHRH